MLISRLFEEKISSIKDALNFFSYYIKKYKNIKCTLKIIGDGNKREEIISFINELNINNKVEIIGEVSNVKEYIEECDIVLGMGRCLIEAISMKRLAVICSYDGLKGIVRKDDINLCIDENFSGRLLENTTSKELTNFILNENIKNII